MSKKLHAETITKWPAAARLKPTWQELHARSEFQSPFSTYEWLDCWYRAYCEDENVRLVVVWEGERVRAILPGMIERKWVGGFRQTCFSYAGTGQTPQCGVIVGKGDVEAARAAMEAFCRQSSESVDLGVFPDIEKQSMTWQVLAGNLPSTLYAFPENSYAAPVYVMPGGWEDYVAGKSKKFRKRLRESFDAADKQGGISYEVFHAGENLKEALGRLEDLDARSWQGQAGRGLFRNADDRHFYSHLAAPDSRSSGFFVCFLRVGGRDAAFTTGAYNNSTAFLLKTGFDPDFKACRPGVLVRAHISGYLAPHGVAEIDLGADESEEKRRWETQNREYESFWVLNRETLRGKILLAELKAYQLFKRIVRRNSLRGAEAEVEAQEANI